MQQIIEKYLREMQNTLASGQATEHSYRPALKTLFESLFKYEVTNEPKRSEHGAPDFIFRDGFIPVAW